MGKPEMIMERLATIMGKRKTMPRKRKRPRRKPIKLPAFQWLVERQPLETIFTAF
jgi:hypothetical protein